MTKRTSTSVLLAVALLAPPLLTVSAATPVVIHNPWLVNDRVADTHNLSTMAATYVNAYTPDGVVAPSNNQDKAINIYNNQKRRMYHWADEPPSVGGNDINDPTYNQNVFGWALCGRHACNGCTIAKAAGFGQRKISVPGDWQMEFIYDGGNHLFHTMMTFYVMTRGTTPHIAGCDEIKADNNLVLNAVAEGRACPGFLLCGDTAAGEVSMVNSYSDGGDAAVTTRWTGNMDLRSGQSFKRTWESWLSEHPTIGGGGTPPYHHEASRDYQDYVNFPYWEPYRLTTAQSTAVNISYNPTYRRWSNGTDTLTPDFRSTAYQALLEPASHDIATYNDDSLAPDLHVATVGTTAEAVFKINVPFYITDANFSGDFVKTNSGDVCNVQVSSNGTSWTTVWTAGTLGTTHVANQPLRSNVFALWTTWYIKVQIKGTVAKSDAGVSNFAVVTTFEHNKGAMAYLDKGTNHITVTMDNPQDLGGTSRLKVTYKWKEYSGADWTIDKAYVKYVSASPTTITLTTAGAKVPRTEYIQMEVVPTPAPDVTAPAAVADLQANGAAGRTSIPLKWTAPGNDANLGEATGYDLRYSTSTIDAGNFASATPVTGIPVPQMAGGTDSFTVTGLVPSTTYYFAIKAFDDDGNTAAISNVASVTTMALDNQAPNAIANLAAAATTTLGRFNVTWTAPADNGNGYVATYDLRWSTSPIATDTFASATPITGLSAPKSAGGSESFAASGLPTGVTVYFAIKAVDDSGNASAISNVPSAKSSIGTMTFQNGLNAYSGAQDTYMSAAAVSTKYEGSTYLQVSGMGGGANRRRAVVKFDLSSLPATAVITKATLYVYAYSNEQHDAVGGYYGAYHVYTPWSAAAVTWNMPWAVSGGADIDGSPDAQAAKQTTTGVWYAFDVTTRAQRYIDGRDSNNGWVIKCLNEGNLNQDWFYASEEPTNTTLRPKLVVSDVPLITDAVPPPAVGDLAAGSVSSNGVTLTWTSPVDYADGGAGPFACSSYNLRYSTNPITNDATFAAATALSMAAPGAPGTAQTRLVTGLTANTTYYFAIKSTDGGGNVSPLSNVATATTLPPDVTAPNWVGNLQAKGSKTSGGIDLTWTAPADYGYNGAGPFTCVSYDLRYSTSPILYNDGDATWNGATAVTGLTAPKTPGSAESFTVGGLTAGTTYYFALKAKDGALPINVSPVSNCASSKPSVLGEKTLQTGLNSYAGCTDSYFLDASVTNYGTNERMWVTGFATFGVGSVSRGVVRFDLTGQIPAGATVTSAKLYLYSYGTSGETIGTTGTYGAYAATRAWTDSQVLWSLASTGVSWTTPGGDFAATPDGTSPKQVSGGVCALNVWYPFDVTARTQSWLASPASNFGWIIKCTDENLYNQEKFYQCNTTNTLLRPKLVVSDLVTPVAGDVNRDGAVDALDLLALANAWGARLGVNRLYDPRCDLNNDGSIDVVDLLTLADNWP